MAGKVYAVMSLVQGNGAKYVSTNIARSIKRTYKKEDRRVLLVDFDFENPFLAYDLIAHDINHGIDTLVPNIYDSTVGKEIFKENIIQTRIDVDVLRGTKFPGKIKQYSKSQIEGILKAAKEIYDDIIVVISCKANNAGTIYTLFHADEVLLIVRDNYTNYMQFDRVIRTIMMYSRNSKSILVIYNMQNQYAKSHLNQKVKDSPIDAEVIAVLEQDERSIDNVDLQKKEKLFAGSKNRKSFMDIAKILVGGAT
ncbi:Cobyrinic acid a,c-diamide synthase (plasmid) [Paenibacillus thiaminolyticus]|uniref:Cobyrinic acid a,c-diamide synthase n=1 Tax=Paenibacillus thiaminolyticus TaxID=49283 RepID=UPI00232F0817|nr:Cobyrinic acid a,c-diamide synthase [Paenibacillus thiaminolyticus]WCF11410.1 Cobyrinic acid a,c-diamide synthase [Paenibacillus thiaminolyticus]